MRERCPELLVEFCRELDTLARREDAEAADRAAEAPYWLPSPPSVVAHRHEAQTLRNLARRLEAEVRGAQLAV